jgi:hypothetical protein
MAGESMPYRDQFYGLMSYNVKTVDGDIGTLQSSDKDILLGKGVDRQHVEGIIG